MLFFRKSWKGKEDRSRPPCYRPRVHTLEDRTLLSFFAVPRFTVGSNPIAEAVGDLNGDGRADLVVVNQGANTVSVLLGNGDGTFGPRTDLTLTTTPVSLAVADLNGDGKLDLAVATEDLTNDYVTVLRGNGDGSFQAPVSTVTDAAPKGNSLLQEELSTIGAGDVNGDGRLDLVIVNNKDGVRVARFGGGPFFSAGTVSVLLGNGDGSFQAPRNFAVGTSPRSVALGDFNGDGRLDFAVGNYASGTVSVFLNTGGGNFTNPTTNALAGSPLSLVAADFNGDGRPDLVAAAFPDLLALLNPPANTVSVHRNNGDGTFPDPVVIANPGAVLSSQVTADFNGDGIPDKALGNGQVELGLGDGNFGDVTNVLSEGGVAAVDIDGNGTPDLLVGAAGSPGSVILLLNSPGWDNRTGGAVGFTVSVAPQATAGANVGVIVTAVDAAGNPVPGFLGTVDLDDTAPGATSLGLLQQYTFTAADAGRHAFVVTGLTRAGLNTLSTYAVAMPTVSVPITVVPAATAKFIVAAPASVTAGTPFAYTVTAEDAFGNVETGYTGTVHFTAGTADTQAVLPADYTFTAADAGVHAFSATLFRSQSLISPAVPSINVADAATHVGGSASPSVLSLAPNSLALFGVPNGATAGGAMSVSVAALDIYGNAAAGYAGTVHFSSSDAQASLPADYTFTPADHGARSFFVTLRTAGAQSLAVTDTGNPAFASQSGVAVFPSMPTTWIVNGLSATGTAGVAQTFTLTALDPFGNVATNHTGVVHFTSSDSQAVLPPDTFFTAADAGRHTFTATLKTAGQQTLTFTDTVITVLTATESITVSPAAAASAQVAGFPTATTAGVAQAITVMLRDAFGNVATGYTGTVAFRSSDPIAALPAPYTFTAADAGVHTFTAALKRAGTQSVTVADTAVFTITSTESGIFVSPAAVTHFAISVPANVTQGVGFSFTVSAVDDFGNVNPGYRGTVHLSSTDPRAGTQNFTFSNNDNGGHVFSYTFNTLGFQTLTITDTTNSSIFGSDIIDVLPQSGGGGGGP